MEKHNSHNHDAALSAFDTSVTSTFSMYNAVVDYFANFYLRFKDANIFPTFL